MIMRKERQEILGNLYVHSLDRICKITGNTFIECGDGKPIFNYVPNNTKEIDRRELMARR